MKALSIVAAVTIYLLILAAGLFHFIRLVRRMKREGMLDLPLLSFFILYSTYGGMLLAVLTTFFRVRSGRASVGITYYIFGASVAPAICAVDNYHKLQSLSRYHWLAYRASVAYYIIAPIVLGVLFMAAATLKAPHWVPLRSGFSNAFIEAPSLVRLPHCGTFTYGLQIPPPLYPNT